MTKRSWDPIRLPFSQWPLSHVDEQIERAFDELLTTPRLSEPDGWLPQFDITKTEDSFVIEADLPGVGLNEMRVDVNGRCVAISGSRSDRRAETREGVIHAERRHSSFSRRLTLRASVNHEDIQVSQEHGVIHIRLPKQSSQE